jgi:CubicO group peptidase (beta-lactamase class C family)
MSPENMILFKPFCTWLLAGLVAGCIGTGPQQTGSAASTADASGVPMQLGDGWAVASPKDAGLDACLLDSMSRAIRRAEDYSNIHALLIVRDSHLVYEEYFPGENVRWRGASRQRVHVDFHRDTLHSVRSVGKTITSALVGIALHSGAIPSLDVPLVNYFPEHTSLLTPEKRRITLRHALTMSAGFEWNEMDDRDRMRDSRDPAAFVLVREVAAEPGSTWYYNTGLPLLLGLVVSRATGRPFGAYAREALFQPLGITEVEWDGPEAWRDIPELAWDGKEPWSRVAHPGGSVWLRPRDLAKFGSLYLNGGRWNGRQVLPAECVEESTRWHIATRDSTSEYGEHGYGYFNWHNDRFCTAEGELEVYSATGNGEQRIFVIPALRLVVVHLAGRYNEDANWMSERLLLNFIVAAARNNVLPGARPCEEAS